MYRLHRLIEPKLLTCHDSVSLLQVLPPETEVTGDIAAGPPHQVVLHTAALGLVWSDQNIGRDEEGSVLRRWHHVVRLVPNSEVLTRFTELTRSGLNHHIITNQTFPSVQVF